MVGAGLTNMASMYGTNDIPNVLVTYFGGIPNKDTMPLYAGRSAMSFIDNVTTPTLILHGANDERVPTGPGLRTVSRAQGPRQDDRARVLSARGPRHCGVLPSEGSADAHLRLGDAVHAGGREDNDPMTSSSTGGADLPPTASSSSPSDSKASGSDTELLATLFELGREVTSVLDLDQLLREYSAADRAG